jgi:PadR family transcriptional regulator PadR
METTQLTQLELVLLELVKKGQGKWSWYEIASALSRRDVPREPDMMVVLKKLAQEGFIQRYLESDSPRDRWELTAEGEKRLNHQISIPTTTRGLWPIVMQRYLESDSPRDRWELTAEGEKRLNHQISIPTTTRGFWVIVMRRRN